MGILGSIKKNILRSDRKIANGPKPADAKKEECITKTLEATSWNRSRAEKEISAARKRTGITYKDYIRFKFYNVPAEEQAAFYHEILEKKELKKRRRDACVDAVVRFTGWTREYAVQQMDLAKKNIGCGYWDYAYNGYFEMTEEEMRQTFKKRESRQQKKEDKKNRVTEECLGLIMEHSGCTREEALEKFRKDSERTGCTPDEYIDFAFYKRDEKTQDSVLLLCHTDKIREKLNFDYYWYRIFKYKEMTNRYLSDYVKRKWCVNTDVSFEEFRDIFENCCRVFYKPVSSFGGRGAQPFDITKDNIRNVYDEIKSLAPGMVEEYVVQHPLMNAMSPTAVNTIRFGTLSSEMPVDEDGRKFKIAYAMLKTGGLTGCVDNLHGGGVGAAIDMATGKLCTDAVSEAGRIVYDKHPVTGMTVKGFEIPFYHEAEQMVQEIIEKYDIKGYLAWDVAITEDGPMLIEANIRPSPTLLVLPFLATEGKGMKDYMQDQVKSFCTL